MFAQIFCGAPQRSDSLFIMESKLYEFLHDDKNAPWLHMLTPSSIQGLAQAALESTDEFLSSKFTLRGRIVSLFANSRTPRKIHPVGGR